VEEKMTHCRQCGGDVESPKRQKEKRKKTRPPPPEPPSELEKITRRLQPGEVLTEARSDFTPGAQVTGYKNTYLLVSGLSTNHRRDE
jgi:hypothetical protein